MCENLIERCEREIEAEVEALFQKDLENGREFARMPFLDLPYPVCDPSVRCWKRLVCKALAARKSFRETGPPWALELPLSMAECERLENDASHRLNLVGFYGTSLMMADYCEQ